MAIHPPGADYINSGIERAIEENAECLIINLNTPGGLLKSTRVIVTKFLQSEIPIIVYVSPSGSQAASAGVFITMAAHIAAMAPGTNIGAAHPVTMQGTQDTIMMEKATNDAAAFIRTISEKRHRNIKWGEDAVRKSLSITETEAIELNVIDIIAKDINDVLEQIDGREVETSNGLKTLHTQNAEVMILEMTFAQKILSILSNHGDINGINNFYSSTNFCVFHFCHYVRNKSTTQKNNDGNRRIDWRNRKNDYKTFTFRRDNRARRVLEG
jgi:membrane-bound serine protease (ClpP class)